ncbi:MAG: antitoxin Xre/MbcA/ParS toxin-binding domain-containing protein [Gemmatimonadota bacterium]
MTANPALKEHRSSLAEASVDAGEMALGSRAALAAWVGTHRSQITRAARGQELGGEEGWRLAGLAAVVTALLTFYEPEAMSGWLHGTNPHLNDRRPLDVLAAGDLAAVMAAVQAARTGVYA